MFVAEALELISTAANHSNAAIRKMVRLCSKHPTHSFMCLVLKKKNAANMLLDQRAADAVPPVGNLAVCLANGLRRLN